ncbi:hypothetical protein BDC45DRAFT_316868 [Circinella umbellata]|nr:hypothetical protein BDC45DRAFT_610329 [Circinella umbellata]KAI7848439.1 hypothetical protein BDC45DRAFT_316868 [Circinella umbellata]
MFIKFIYFVSFFFFFIKKTMIVSLVKANPALAPLFIFACAGSVAVSTFILVENSS